MGLTEKPKEDLIHQICLLQERIAALEISNPSDSKERAYREMGREALRILNEPGDLPDAIRKVLTLLKEKTGLDAVAIRRQKGDDFPYYVQDGFPDNFLLKDNSLIACDEQGRQCRDNDGKASLQCWCGMVISGNTAAAGSLCTPGGSFWTNDSLLLLDIPSGKDPRHQLRHHCSHLGYASFAIIPIRTREAIVGLIQVNDRRKDCFTLEMIESIEGIGTYIGSAMMRKDAEDLLALKAAILEKSEAKYRALLEVTGTGFLILDSQGRVVDADQEYVRLSGHAEFGEIRGRSVIEWTADSAKTANAEAVARCVKDGFIRDFVTEYADRNGRITIVEVNASVEVAGESFRIVSLCRDITVRRQADKDMDLMRQQLIQSDKLASLGEMASGMAHEINQPLNAIALITTAFRKYMEKKRLTDDILAAGIKDIDAMIRRMSQTINHVRSFARQDAAEMVTINLTDTINGAFCLMGEQMKMHEITVTMDIDPGLPPVKGIEHQLEQVWINLIGNARDAMEEKEARIKAGLLSLPGYHKELRISLSHDKETGQVQLVFADNGKGLDPAVADKAFDPFFTTKAVGKGTGLGLSISRGIIQAHRGVIRIEGRQDEGATLTVSLPVA